MDQIKIQHSMTQRERELILSVSDADKDVLLLVFMLRSVCVKAQKMDFVTLLDWLSKNRYRGNRFMHFYMVEHDRSMLNLASFVRKQIFNDWQKRPVLGKYNI